MYLVAMMTFKGFLRDKVAWSILLVVLLLCLVPALATLSMRQVVELALTLSLSLISFVLLIFSVFLGGSSLWKDIDRRYTYSVVSLPISRSSYLLGKFAGTGLFLVVSAAAMLPAVLTVVQVTAWLYPPDRSVQWGSVLLCVGFDVLKYLLLVACAFLFSTVSTSFFLPIFGTIIIYISGSLSQQVYDYFMSGAAGPLSPLAKALIDTVYFLVPNFSVFNLKVNAIYGLPIDFGGLLLVAGYFGTMLAIVLSVACFVFRRREMK